MQSFILILITLANIKATVPGCIPCSKAHEIELLLGIAAYSLLPWRGGATLFCFTRCKCWRDGVIYNITNDFILTMKIIVRATLKIQSFTLKLHYRNL